MNNVLCFVLLATLSLCSADDVSEPAEKFLAIFNGHDNKNGTKKDVGRPCAGVFVAKKWILTQNGCFCDVKGDPVELNYLHVYPQLEDFKDYLKKIHVVNKDIRGKTFILLELNKELPVPVTPIEINTKDEKKIQNATLHYFKKNPQTNSYYEKTIPVDFQHAENITEAQKDGVTGWTTLRNLSDITNDDISGSPIVYEEDGKTYVAALFSHVMYYPTLFTLQDWNRYSFILTAPLKEAAEAEIKAVEVLEMDSGNTLENRKLFGVV